MITDMTLKINGVDIAQIPDQFIVVPFDYDDPASDIRTADGTKNRDRVAVKRQISMSWDALEWETISKILKSMEDMFFDFYYPDPLDGDYVTKTFSVGNRPAAVGIAKDGKVYWEGLSIILEEK